jgi:hypothetical protein
LSGKQRNAHHDLNDKDRIATIEATSAEVYDPELVPFFLGIGCVSPPHTAPHRQVIDAMVPLFQMSEKKNTQFRRIAENCMIDQRYCVLNSVEGMFFNR